ncbi:unnamed protein product [Peronospora destructor]|uniref:RxLR effector protein n=1 Tax=Peronospora destructor TaxID=86335 RepID=A0AAV0UX15_9STRA|nr:unnamed protein product [Peronospora destructor]
MRLDQFLLLVTLTCIACDSIVASSKGLIQVKILDATSQRELTDGTRRKLRGSLKKDDIADVEERAQIPLEDLGNKLNGMKTKLNGMKTKLDGMQTKSKDVANKINLKSKSLLEQFKNFIAKLKRTKTAKTVPKQSNLDYTHENTAKTVPKLQRLGRINVAPPRTNTRENTVPKLQNLEEIEPNKSLFD